jgi:hypothetical protein
VEFDRCAGDLREGVLQRELLGCEAVERDPERGCRVTDLGSVAPRTTSASGPSDPT